MVQMVKFIDVKLLFITKKYLTIKNFVVYLYNMKQIVGYLVLIFIICEILLILSNFILD